MKIKTNRVDNKLGDFPLTPSHTIDGKLLFSGRTLFELRSTHGLPLDFALSRVITGLGMAVDWVGFIETARRNNWWDYQTYEVICHGMEDAGLPKEMQSAIRTRFQKYVLLHQHPKMSGAE
jgi:alanyl-tRNA synthetase